MRRRHRDEVLEVPEIPLDLQIEILNRLPIKSLARFKCVSKFWSFVIHSKGYLFPSPPRLYISLVQEPSYDLVSLSLASIISKSGNNVFDLDLKNHGIGGYNMVALRGLILYNDFEQACIYNPTTGQRVILPKILAEEDENISQLFYFGYDPVLDQYKVLSTAVGISRSIYTHHCVFVLEAGSFWKRNQFDYPHYPKGGMCINGVIYYLADCFEYGDKVISFNVRFEEFSTIQLPHEVSMRYLGLIEYGGKPTLFDITNLKDSLVNLWVLEDTGIWLKKPLVLQPCQMHFFPHNIRFYVYGTTHNGEVILKPRNMSYPYYILYYDLQSNDVRRVDIKGISQNPIYLTLMDTGESILHLKI